MRPIHDRLIVKRDAPRLQTEGGVYIPTAGQDSPAVGVVIAAGTGRLLKNGVLHPLIVKVGDRVLFSQHAGSDVSIQGEDYLVLRENEVLATIYEGEKDE